MKTKKIFGYGLIVVIAAVALTLTALSLTGCGGGNVPDPVHVHQWGEYVVTTPANCTTAGVETRVCALVASHKETRDIAIDLDAHNYEWTATTTATCTTAGEEAGICTHDNAHTTTRAVAIDPDAHNYEWTATTPANCTTEGEEAGICTHDNTHTTTRAVAIDPDAHDYQWVTIPPSAIEEGMDKEICSRCAHESGNTRNPVQSSLITTTEEWNSALALLNGKTGSYTLTIGGSFNVVGSNTDTFGTTAAGSALSVTLKGNGTVSLSSQGNLIRVASNQSLIIDSEGLILQGLKNGQNDATQNNNNSTLYVTGTGAQLELKNGTISGSNTSSSSGGGVYVNSNGTFTMRGGEISGNIASTTADGWAQSGGGVYVLGTFTMNGGEISGNTASGSGGGVYVLGTFTMNGGEISGNTSSSGGGVYVYRGTFTMNSGEISGNIVSEGYGGGVYVSGTIGSTGTFTMNGGEIFGNTVVNNHGNAYGGGVYVYRNPSNGDYGIFRIVTGTVYGSDGGELSNTLTGTSTSGAALYRYNNAPAQRGTFSGTTWTSKGDLSTTDNTIRVVNGESQ